MKTIEVRSAHWLPLHKEVLGPRCEVPGIEVPSTESRCKASWIEVRSTKMFHLNWDDAQTWVGQLLLTFYKEHFMNIISKQENMCIEF